MLPSVASAFADRLAAIPDLTLRAAPETAKYAVDRRTPHWVVRPGSVEALAAVVRAAAGNGIAVVPWGGGHAQDLGGPLTAYDLALETTGLNQILDHQPADLVAICQAGVTLGELAAALAPAGQFLPLDPAGGGARTLGGVLAARSSGPRRIQRGQPRDLVLGMQVVLPEGEVARTGGRVVKNVSGYDLSKLMIGSLGTLGVITEVSLRLFPVPVREQTYRAAFASEAAALAAAEAVRQLAIPLTALLVLDAAAAARLGVGARSLLVVRLEGAEAAQARRAALVAEHAPDLAPWSAADATAFWEAMARFPLRRAEEETLILRGGALPVTLPAVATALQRAASAQGLRSATLYDAGSGIFHSRWDLPLVEGLALVEPAQTALAQVRAALQPDGYLVVEAAPPELKPALDLWGPAGDEMRLAHRLKARLDPHQILAPGRFPT